MGDDRLVDRALAEQLLVVIARVGGDVRVAIDQSRQHGRAAQVDDSGARWRVTRHRTRRADLLDTLALDQDRLVGEGRASAGVDETTGLDDDRSEERRVGKEGRSRWGR